MCPRSSLRTRIDNELALGREAAAVGNAGRARVCARRAAGWAIQAWYQRQEGMGWAGDALNQLQRLQSDAAVPPPVRQAAERLSTKVGVDHRLPFDDDALEDARKIIEYVADTA